VVGIFNPHVQTTTPKQTNFDAPIPTVIKQLLQYFANVNHILQGSAARVLRGGGNRDSKLRSTFMNSTVKELLQEC